MGVHYFKVRPTSRAQYCEVTPPYSKADRLSCFKGGKRIQPRRYLQELIIFVIITKLLGMESPSTTKLCSFARIIMSRSNASTSVFRISLLYMFYILHIRTSKGTKKKGLKMDIRRCWLSCLILASKYHEDCNYSLKAWGKLSGLSPTELKSNEMAVLDYLDFNMDVNQSLYRSFFSGSGLFDKSNFKQLPLLPNTGMPATCTQYCGTLARLRLAMACFKSHATRCLSNLPRPGSNSEKAY